MKQKLIYPRMKCGEKKNTVICKSDKKKIFQLSKKGNNAQQIANKFGVNQSTIYYVLNPDSYEKFKKHVDSEWLKKYHSDAEFRKKTKEISKKSINRRRKDPKYKKWEREYNKRYREKNKEKINTRRRMKYVQQKNTNVREN